MRVKLSLLFSNGKQDAKFSLYDFVIYYLLIDTIFGKYDFGYQFFAALSPEGPVYKTFRWVDDYRYVLEKVKKTGAIPDPVVLHGDYTVAKGMGQVAAAAYFGIADIEIVLTTKPVKTEHDLEWLKSVYSPGECAEIEKQRCRIFLDLKERL